MILWSRRSLAWNKTSLLLMPTIWAISFSYVTSWSVSSLYAIWIVTLRGVSISWCIETFIIVRSRFLFSCCSSLLWIVVSVKFINWLSSPLKMIFMRVTIIERSSPYSSSSPSSSVLEIMRYYSGLEAMSSTSFFISISLSESRPLQSFTWVDYIISFTYNLSSSSLSRFWAC